MYMYAVLCMSMHKTLKNKRFEAVQCIIRCYSMQEDTKARTTQNKSVLALSQIQATTIKRQYEKEGRQKAV